MDTLVLHAQVSSDGHVTVLLLAEFANQAVEIVVRRAPRLATGEGPIGAFESLDKIAADDLLERPEQGEYEERDEIE